jgi:putative transposase
MEDTFRVAFTCHPRRELALRYAKGSAPAPVALTAQTGNPTVRAKNWLKPGGKVSGAVVL